MRTKTIECVMQGDKPIPILEMYESFNGWVLVYHRNREHHPDYMFGLVVGLETE